MVNGWALRSVVEQRDLVVQVHSYFKVAVLRDRMVMKAFSTHAFIGQCTENRNRDVLLQLNMMLLRPYLEHV